MLLASLLLCNKDGHIRKCMVQTLKTQPAHNCISCWNLPKKIPTTKIWSKQILKANNTEDWWCRYNLSIRRSPLPLLSPSPLGRPDTQVIASTNHFVTLMIFMNYSCILNIGMSHTKIHISPGGEGTARYAILLVFTWRH